MRKRSRKKRPPETKKSVELRINEAGMKEALKEFFSREGAGRETKDYTK